jgi:hypothetical protein
MNIEKLRASFNQFLRLVQLGFALLLLCMGGLLLLVLVLSLPDMIRTLLAGDVAKTFNAFIMASGGCALCWLQWRYRHVLYPMLRHEA